MNPKNAVVATMLALGVIVGLKEGWWSNARKWIDNRINATHAGTPAGSGQGRFNTNTGQLQPGA